MIEHMKSFANEHHTLIVVIIGVLVACFLYWFFCCKDRPSVNKIKGGRCAVFELTNDIYAIGLKLAPEIPVLSMSGVDLLLNKDNWIKDGIKIIGNIDYVIYTFTSKNAISTILSDPLDYLKTKLKPTLNYDSKKYGFVALSLFKNLQNELNKIFDKFDFKSILESAFPKDIDFVKDVIKLINTFSAELSRDINIKLASFIGQLGRLYNSSIKTGFRLNQKKFIKDNINNPLSFKPLLDKLLLVCNKSLINDYIKKLKTIIDKIDSVKIKINNVIETKAEILTHIEKSSTDIHKYTIASLFNNFDEKDTFYTKYKQKIDDELTFYANNIANFDDFIQFYNDRCNFFNKQEFYKSDHEYLESFCTKEDYINQTRKNIDDFINQLNTIYEFRDIIVNADHKFMKTKSYLDDDDLSDLNNSLIDNELFDLSLNNILNQISNEINQLKTIKNTIIKFINEGLQYMNEYNDILSKAFEDTTFFNADEFLNHYFLSMSEFNNTLLKKLSIKTFNNFNDEFSAKKIEIEKLITTMELSEKYKTGKKKAKKEKQILDGITNEISNINDNIIKVINFIIEVTEIMEKHSKQSGGNVDLVDTISTTKKTFEIIHILLHTYTNKCRRWFTKDSTTSPYRQKFFYYYLHHFNINIEKGGKDGGIADIYPAEKLCLFLIYVSLYAGVEIHETETNDDLYRIDDLNLKIAAYVLYVFLFNTWCACIMQQKWNSSVLNEYVYEYKKINGQVQMTFDEKYMIDRLAASKFDDLEFVQKLFSLSSDKGQENITNVVLENIPDKQDTIMITKEKPCLVPKKMYVEYKRNAMSKHRGRLNPCDYLILLEGDSIILEINKPFTLGKNQQVSIRNTVHIAGKVLVENYVLELLETEESETENES